jgi:hypothetical protein
MAHVYIENSEIFLLAKLINLIKFFCQQFQLPNMLVKSVVFIMIGGLMFERSNLKSLFQYTIGLTTTIIVYFFPFNFSCITLMLIIRCTRSI